MSNLLDAKVGIASLLWKSLRSKSSIKIFSLRTLFVLSTSCFNASILFTKIDCLGSFKIPYLSLSVNCLSGTGLPWLSKPIKLSNHFNYKSVLGRLVANPSVIILY